MYRYIATVIRNQNPENMKILLAILFLSASSLVSDNNTSSVENTSTEVTRFEVKIPKKKKTKIKFRKTMLAFESNTTVKETYA